MELVVMPSNPYLFTDFNPDDPFMRYSSGRSIDSLEQGTQMSDLDRQILECQRYLRASRAVRTPIEVYALWVELYDSYGGVLQHRSQSFTSENWWTPTQPSGLPIPSASGVFALRLVMVPALIRQDLRPTSGDSRCGLEYGQGRVHSFEQSPDGKILVAVNDYKVATYPDVEQLRYSMTPQDLAQRAVDLLAQAHQRSASYGDTNQPNSVAVSQQ